MSNNNPQESGEPSGENKSNREEDFDESERKGTVQGASGNKEADLVNTTGGQGKMGNIQKQKKTGGSVSLEGNT